jgi:3-hydroxy-D-aspartate aldolase
MMQPPPALPGMYESDIDTPALVIDLDAFEFNLDQMAKLLAPTGAQLRAHVKTHKSTVIAHLQLARGAVGQCVQKVAEAEALAWGACPIS